MFKLAFALVALVALASAAPSDNVYVRRTTPIPILYQKQDGPHADGSYSYSYGTGNGIQVEEQGHVKNRGHKDEAMTAKGSYSYIAPDGQKITVTYEADENGFRPQGAHLPTPPPMPWEIRRGLDYIANNPKWEEPRNRH